MEEIITKDIMNNKLAMNLLFLVVYEIIIAIISYKSLEKYSWKECSIANLILTVGVSLIKLNGLGFLKILIFAVVQTAIMVVVENYIYNKDYDIKDSIFRTIVLNIFALGGFLCTCIIFSGATSFGQSIKIFGIIILFIIGITALGYVLLNGQRGSGLLILVDSVIYIIALFILLKIQGVDINQISESSHSVNSLLKMIAICCVLGVSTGMVCKSAYDETDEMKNYLIISALKTYAIDMTMYLGIIAYVIWQLANLMNSFNLINF